MTTVKEPVKTYTNVPKPIVAPSYAPPARQPVEAPAVEERELVPVRRREQSGANRL